VSRKPENPSPGGAAGTAATDQPGQEPQPFDRPRFARALRRALTDAYDHLGVVGAATFLWGLAIGLPIEVATAFLPGWWGPLTAALVSLFTSAAANAGIFYLAGRIAAREPASLLDLAKGVAEFFWRSLGLTALVGGVGGVVLVNAVFYLTRGSRIAGVIGFVCLYLVALWCMVSLYAYPLLVARRQRPVTAFRNSAALAMDNMGFTLQCAAFALGVTTVVAVPVLLRMPYLVGLSALIALFLYAGFLALLANHALLELLKKY
jgi:hypothetical protein